MKLKFFASFVMTVALSTSALADCTCAFICVRLSGGDTFMGTESETARTCGEALEAAHDTCRKNNSFAYEEVELEAAPRGTGRVPKRLKAIGPDHCVRN